MEQNPLSLYELNALVRQSVRLSMPDAYWVQAELSDVRTNYSGHCYVEFVQKDPRSNALLAKARGIIWNNVFCNLKPYFERETGQAFGDRTGVCGWAESAGKGNGRFPRTIRLFAYGIRY